MSKDIEDEIEEKAQENEAISSEAKPYTDEDLADMKEKFMMFDDDGGGGLTANELEKCKMIFALQYILSISKLYSNDNILWWKILHSNYSVLQYMGHNPTLKEVDDIIASVDADGTGEIEFDEFVDLMQKIKNSYPIGRT